MAARATVSDFVSHRTRGRALSPLVALCAASAIVFSVASRGRPAPALAPSAPVVAAFDSIAIPVPAEPVTAGTRLSAVPLKYINYPKHQIPEGALTNLDALQESVALTALPASLPFFRENFSESARISNPVIDKIPPGMRAMTIKVDATTSVEGWAGSGSVVDVLLVEKERTSVVAEQVRILSAERSVSPVEGSAAPNVPSTVTLLVTQEQCLAINTAIPLGRIAFALRNDSDGQEWTAKNFSAENLKGRSSAGLQRSLIRGYASANSASGEQKFALIGERWVPTDITPSTFATEKN